MDCLIVVDMQNDFIDGCLGNEQTAKNVAPVLTRIQEFQGPIIFTKDSHEKDYLETTEGKFLPVEHCIKNTDGEKIQEELIEGIDLQPLTSLDDFTNIQEDGRYVVEKEVFGSELLTLGLQKIQDKIENIYLCGLCTDICVVTNALLLRTFLKDANIYVYQAATEGTSIQAKEAALQVMRSCNVHIL